MSWGKWIVTAFVLFVAFIGTIVTVCVRQDVSLVSREYYKDEIAFQQQIERKRNTEQLQQKPEIKIAGNQLIVQFGSESSIESGTIKLFRPSAASLDQNFVLSKSDDTVRVFELTKAQPGAYRVKMNWSMEGKEYYFEKTITI